MKTKNTWIFGDIHGEFNKLKSCIESVNISKGDRIISLGDLVDRGNKSFEVVQYCIDLSKEYECIFIRGNHDYTFYQSIVTGLNNLLFNQGGKETLQSYIKNCNPDKEIYYKMKSYITDFELNDYPIEHINFFKNQLPYYIDEDNNCFVHGGFNRHHLIEETEKYGDISDLWWDRDLLHAARSYSSMKNNEYSFKMKNNFKEVFVGHTPVQMFYDDNKPMKFANIWNLDTGAGKYNNGVVTIINLHTKECKQF